MTKRYAVIFPGQGSQALGMMSQFKTTSTVLQTFEEASDTLRLDLWEVINDERLHETEFTQPVILTASIALWRVLSANLPCAPSYLAGHSLGEYSALCASGVLDFATAVQLVHLRGQLMTKATTGIATQMLAILGLGDDEVQALCQNTAVDPANFNSPGQVVVAGEEQAVAEVATKVRALGKKALPLKVSVPSHCRLMAPASEKLAVVLENTPLHSPRIPVIQNVAAVAYDDVASIKGALIAQLSKPVQWTKTMEQLATLDLDCAIECGFGSVLANLAKRQATPLSVLTSDSTEKIAQILTTLEQ